MARKRSREELESENRGLCAYQRLAWDLMKGKKLKKLVYGERECEVIGLTNPDGGIVVFDRVSVLYADDAMSNLNRAPDLSHERGLAALIKSERERAIAEKEPYR